MRPSAVIGLLFAGAVLLSAATPAGADVTGTVTIQGAPNSKDVSFYAAASACGGSPIRHTENWKIGPQGQLQDVVVWIVDPKFSDRHLILKPAEPELHQIHCRYVPHVLAVTAGVPFKIINNDATLHNIRAKVYDGPGQPPGADVFNFGQSYKGQVDEQTFDSPGIYTLQCDVHDWMQCWVMALANPCYAVTGPDGTFTIQFGADLADGDYKIDAWHPRFAQTLEQTVHVKDGAGTVHFQFEGAKSF